MRLLPPLILAAAAALSASAGARTAGDAVPGLAVERAVLTMRTGEHRWDEQDAAGGPVSVVISVPMQMAFVYRDDVLIGASTVSTGKPGKMTPIGEYTILQKKPFHRSNLYNNAPMPFMQRLTWDGIAIHAGALPGFPASHGCIRIPTNFARQLFAATELGARVAVVNQVIPFPAIRPATELPVLTVPATVLEAGSQVTRGSRVVLASAR